MTRNWDKHTPLHHAAANNDAESVKQLIAQGADVNAQDREGFSPLHYAAQEYAVDAAKALLDARAEVDTTNKYGNTPLWTATFNSRGRGDMIKLLRESGSDPWHKNHHGQSPVGLARLIANYNVKQYFADLPELPRGESQEMSASEGDRLRGGEDTSS